jgi:MscS family membrane protein
MDMWAAKIVQFVAATISCAFAVFTSCAFAQEPTPLRPLQPSNTTSPAATLKSLIDSCNEFDELIKAGALTEERASEVLPTTERILDCLDLSELPKELRNTAGVESALFLKEVLDRIELPPIDEIPVPEDPAATDSSRSLQRWQIPDTRIVIARVEGSGYLFSPETVRKASEFYRIVKGLSSRTEGPAVSPGLYDAYVSATKKKPIQTADTSSPRGTMTLFLDTCNRLYEEVGKDRYVDRSSPEFQKMEMQIISCLDNSKLPEASRDYYDAEAAVSLKEVLDRIPLPAAEEIPGIEAVESADGSESLTRWQVPRTQIVISKMTEGPRRGEFLFSSETVARAVEFYRKAQSQPYRKEGRPVSKGFYQWWLSRPGNPVVAAWVDQLPNWFQDRYSGMAVWQWIGLLVVLPISLILMIVAIRLGRTRRDQIKRRKLMWHWFGIVFNVIAILIPLGFKYFVFEYLTLRGTALYIVGFCANVVFLLAVLILIVRLSNRIGETLVALPNVAQGGPDASLIRIICQVLGIVAAVIVFLEGGRYLGFPLTTLIASAGIGGLAVALSAQGLIKGLFGTVTILLDRPYRVGERIMVKGHDGFVEEIGLRSTKIRALDNRLISIPNDTMCESEIENIGSHENIRRCFNIHIPLDTPLAKIEKAVDCIRDALKDHEGMAPNQPPLVHFSEFNPDSFNIRVMFWYSPPEIEKFHQFSENVNLSIMKTFEEHGVQFSLPFRHTYWKTDDQQGPLDVNVKHQDE